MSIMAKLTRGRGQASDKILISLYKLRPVNIAGDAPPVRTVDRALRRIGESAWPAADPVPMR